MAEPDQPATSERAPRPGRRSFAPVVVIGLATSALAAVACAKPWYGVASPGGKVDASIDSTIETGTRYPAATGVSLVLLAAWGVLLVTRGRVRRVFTVIATLAALGLVATVVSGYVHLPDSAGTSFDQLMGRAGEKAGFTGWFWTAAITAVLAVLPAAAAVRLAPGWPEMGSRYDAPGSRADAAPDPTVPETDRDLWHALDEGRDPTDPPRG